MSAASSRLTSSVAAPLRLLARAPSATARSLRSVGGRGLALVDARPRFAVGLLVVLSTLLLGGAGALSWAALTTSARHDQGQAAIDVAATVTPTLLSYSPDTVDGVVGRVGGDLTDALRLDYTTLMIQVVAPGAKQQQITTDAQVVGRSLVDTEGDTVTGLLFLNQSSHAGDGAPQVSGSRVRVTLRHVDGRWLLSDLKPV